MAIHRLEIRTDGNGTPISGVIRIAQKFEGKGTLIFFPGIWATLRDQLNMIYSVNWKLSKKSASISIVFFPRLFILLAIPPHPLAKFADVFRLPISPAPAPPSCLPICCAICRSLMPSRSAPAVPRSRPRTVMLALPLSVRPRCLSPCVPTILLRPHPTSALASNRSQVTPSCSPPLPLRWEALPSPEFHLHRGHTWGLHCKL